MHNYLNFTRYLMIKSANLATSTLIFSRKVFQVNVEVKKHNSQKRSTNNFHHAKRILSVKLKLPFPSVLMDNIKLDGTTTKII